MSRVGNFKPLILGKIPALFLGNSIPVLTPTGEPGLGALYQEVQAGSHPGQPPSRPRQRLQQGPSQPKRVVPHPVSPLPGQPGTPI